MDRSLRYDQRPHFSAPPLAFNAPQHQSVTFDDDAEWSHMMEHALPVRLRRSSSADIPIPQFMIPCSANELMNKRYALSSPEKAVSVSNMRPEASSAHSPVVPTALRKP
ncbi:hypothetical protein FI667_g3133, partial [Globisporangium splendens]